ncbi:MAG TPA: sigma-70 family RNA polymerase sigma factor [Gemmata sp.]
MDTTSASLLRELHLRPSERHWERFVKTYTPLLYQWSRARGLQDADAVDLVQDVFALLVRKLPEFRYDSGKSFRGWLRTVALNRWRETVRNRGARVGGDAGLEQLVAPDDSWFGETEFRLHVVRRVMELIKHDFHEDTWRAFWDHAVTGRPAPLVARDLRTTPGAIYAAKVRVIARLREELAALLVN